MKYLSDDHDPGDEDPGAARERFMFPVVRPENSGQHYRPGWTGFPITTGRDDKDLREWIREEALNFEKMVSGEERMDFVTWKKQRDERARIVRGGGA